MICNIKKVAITTILVLMVCKTKNMTVAMILVKIQDQELGACNNSGEMVKRKIKNVAITAILVMMIHHTENVAIRIIEYSDSDGDDLLSSPGRQSGVAKHKEK